MRYVIEPLNFEYETISMRTTDLENFFNCEFKYKFGKNKFSNNDALLFGTLVHSVLQSYFYKPEAGLNTLDLICHQYNDWCGIIYDYIRLIDEKLLTDKYKIFTNEYKNIIEIECFNYLFILEGTIDAISKDDDGKYVLIDFKTSKAERSPEQFETKIQKFIYSRLLSRLVGEDNIKSFDYIILTKHKKPRLQVLEYKPDRKYINELVGELFKKYAESLKTNMRNPHINKTCFFCDLKDKCPLQQPNSDNF